MSFLSLFQLLRFHKTALAVAVVLMIAESGVSLVIPYFIGRFSASLLDNQSIWGLSLGWLAVIWIGLIVLQALLRFESTFRTNVIGAQVLQELSCRLYDHVQMLPMTFFSKRKKGEILSLISNDANVLAYFFSGVVTAIIPAALVVVGAMIMMATIDVSIAILITISVPLFFLVIKIVGRAIRPISEQVIQHQAGGTAIATENIGSMQLIKAFNRQNVESNKFRRNTEVILNLRKRLLRVQALVSPMMQMLMSIGVVVIVLACAWQFQSGALSLPQLVTLLMYGLVFAKPITTFAGLYGQLQQALGSSVRIIDVFNQSPESSDQGLHDLDCKQGFIQFHDVNFHYDGQAQLLNNINFFIESGSTTAILGENGSGKTTLLHLLMRFTEPQSGKIFIDDQNIRQCNIASLRREIGLVSQDIALFNGTILENIAFGLPDASLEQVQYAANLAGVDRLIEALELSYSTQVGDNGVMLSGGQRQRISLARALLINPQIFLFDEPTSFSDTEGKKEFANLLAQHLNNKTVIIVTHDEQLGQLVDNVIEIHRGIIS
jgi:ABC-type multidrug transport system fused ATPase/permease subunit